MNGERVSRDGWHVVPVPNRIDDFVLRLAGGLAATIGKYERFAFANANILVRTEEPGRDVRRVLLVHDGYGCEDGRVLELGLVADALARQRDVEIWCLLRYLPYSRGNRVSEPGVSLSASVMISLLDALPITRFVSYNLHAPELLGFFRTPVHLLDGLPAVCASVSELGRDYRAVVGTDRGRADECSALARHFGCQPAFYSKRRSGHESSSRTELTPMPHLAGQDVLLFDDEIETGSSSWGACTQLAADGVAGVDVVNFYDFARPGIYERLATCRAVRSILRTNLSTVAPAVDRLPAIEIDVSGLFCDRFG